MSLNMLSKEGILSIVSTELNNSNILDSVTSNLDTSMNSYLGGPDGKEIEGRSQVVSTDVADAIEWIMPQVMKSFTQNNEIVIFDPVHEGDELQAELESEYVYEVLMKQNDGFIVIHQFVKDALMQRNGILKVYYAKKNEEKIKKWTGLSELQLNQILASPEIELLEYEEAHSFDGEENIIPTYNVTIKVVREKGRIYVDAIPREEFRINNRHNSIDANKARFTAHVTNKTASDVIEEFGLDLEETKELPKGSLDFTELYRFELTEESVFYGSDEPDDESLKEVEVAECYMRMDYNRDGIAELVKVTVAGGRDGNAYELLWFEEIDEMPWVTTTGILMSHKFEGLSIYDRLKHIEQQKTTLWRNMFDNIYLQNNQRNVVLEGQVNLDDLMVSRPGGIIRAKSLDAIRPLDTPQMGQDAYLMMKYLDEQKAARTGVEPDGPATPQNIGDRVGSEGVERLMNAKEELVGLIIRVFAETGMKPLCVKIRNLAVNHIDAVVDFRFRGVWQQINPSLWLDRTSTTVRVGTGVGNHQGKISALLQVMSFQEKALQNPQQTIVDQQRIYNTIDDFCKFSGLNGAVSYFIDPRSPEGQQKQQQLQISQQTQSEKEAQLQQQLIEAQQKIADAEELKSQSDAAAKAAKAKIDFLNVQLEEAKKLASDAEKSAKIRLEKRKQDFDVALELTKLEIEKNQEKEDASDEFKENVSDINKPEDTEETEGESDDS